MNHKLMGTILSLLMVTSIFTMGFASWTIVNVDAYEEITGDIQSENIIDVGRYLKMPSATPLKYNRDGFLGSDKYNSSIDLMGYSLNVALAKEELNLNEVDIVIKLNYIDLKPSIMNIFEDVAPEVYYNGKPLVNNVTVSKSNLGIKTTIRLDSSYMNLATYNFDLKYIFNLNNKYFGDSNSPLWTKSQPVFKVSSLLQIK